MELIPLKLRHISNVVSWVKTEADMIQWAGSAFTWHMSQRQFRQHVKSARQAMPGHYPFTLDKDDKNADKSFPERR